MIKEDKLMSKKYIVLKINKEVISNSRMVDSPYMKTRESEELTKAGAELVEVSAANNMEVIQALKNADIILLGNAPITRWIIESAPKCVAIISGGVGYDPIDVQASTDNNILVVNNPAFEWCVEQVSNHAIVLMLALAKKTKILDKLVSEGRWADAKKDQSPMGSIYGQTLGIVGCGVIGRMVARKAQCFGMKIIGYDPYLAQPYLAKENGISLTSLADVLKADYVSLHPDLNETSFHIINDKAFGYMKPSAYLINTSRGKVVDEVALVQALQQKQIAGAGLDVFEVEPLPKDSPLTKMENVILSPHSASYSDYSFSLMPINIAREVGRILAGKWPLNPVNKGIKPRVTLIKDN